MDTEAPSHKERYLPTKVSPTRALPGHAAAPGSQGTMRHFHFHESLCCRFGEELAALPAALVTQ